MNFFNVQGFIECYGLPSLIISIISSIICIVLDLTLKNKLFSIKSYLPFIISTAFMLLYEVIFGAFFLDPTKISSAGIICGSTSSIIFAIFKRIKNGKQLYFTSPKELLIEGILDGIVLEDKKQCLAKEVFSIFTLAPKDKDEKELFSKIENALFHSLSEGITELDLKNAVNLIIKALTS